MTGSRRFARFGPLIGVVVLLVLVARIGLGPVANALGRVGPGPLLAALALGAVATVGCGYRWRLVAAGLGLALPLPTAVVGCYRAQFLNAVLPGGVLGDVHRGLGHGRAAGRRGAGLGAVAAERVAGQSVQLAITAVTLTFFPSPVRPLMPAILALVAGLAITLAMVSRSSAVSGAVRAGVRGAWPGVAASSVVVVVCHLAVFLVAARVAGCALPTVRLLPLAMLVLAAAAIPTNLAGWGPREGVAAWAFTGAGAGAGQGLAVSVVYGVLAFVATAPGALVLLVPRSVPPTLILLEG